MNQFFLLLWILISQFMNNIDSNEFQNLIFGKIKSLFSKNRPGSTLIVVIDTTHLKNLIEEPLWPPGGAERNYNLCWLWILYSDFYSVLWNLIIESNGINWSYFRFWGPRDFGGIWFESILNDSAVTASDLYAEEL